MEHHTSTFLAFIPRGLEHVVCDMIQQQEFQHTSTGASNCSNSNPTDTQPPPKTIFISTKIIGEEFYSPNDNNNNISSSFVTNVRTKLQLHMYQNDNIKKHHHKCIPMKTKHPNDTTTTESTTTNIITTNTNTMMMIKKINQIACSTLVGTMEYTSNQHVSIGYATTTTTTTTTKPKPKLNNNESVIAVVPFTNVITLRNDQIWTIPGQMSGIVWMEITICQTYPTIIDNHIRFLGPIMALVAYYDNHNNNNNNNNIQLLDHQSVEDAGKLIQSIIQNDPYYEQKFHTALQLWRRHVQHCWPEVIHHPHHLNTVRTTHNIPTPLKYRISCMRNDSKKYIYTRRELLQHLDFIIPSSLLYDYTVDLTNYDLEVVLTYRPHCFVIGFALRPYQLVGSGKSFATGELPPDIAVPIISSSTLFGHYHHHIPRVVRLRPSTAQILLHLACIQPGDILLDPCVGIGTIPMETRIQYRNKIFAMGGDLAMNDPSFHTVTVEYLRRVRTMTRRIGNTTTNNEPRTPIPDLLAWDATHLPIRSESIDVIVTDLPFGQLCMSAVKLDAFLPLAIAEMARVLRPTTGRMVLLCGSYVTILRTLIYANECLISNPHELIWELPCTAVFPVNIGGNLAWIVQVRRSCGRPKSIPDQRDKIRHQVQKREHTEKMMLGSKVSKMKHPQS